MPRPSASAWCRRAWTTKCSGAFARGGLAAGPPNAIRRTKYALDNCLRSVDPAFDASLTLESMGFVGEEAREGLASLAQKRAPRFAPDSPA